MPDIIDSFAKASFAGTAFPYTKLSIHGGLNHHVHSYLHRPGAEIEPLGRKPYEFTFHCEFHTTMRAWVRAYPELLSTLFGIFDTEVTADLVVPNVGTVRAKAIKWTRDLTAKIRSGEPAEFVFLEDAQTQLLATAPVAFSMAAVPIQAAVLSDLLVQQGQDPSLLDVLLGLIADLLALRDQIELMGAIIAMKAEQIMDACAALERLFTFDDPLAWPVLDALRDVWASANTVSVDALRRSLPLDSFFVPRVMTVSEVSIAVYGDTEHALELLQLNAFNDAMRIPPGALVKHYAT